MRQPPASRTSCIGVVTFLPARVDCTCARALAPFT